MARGKNAIAAANRRARIDNEIMEQAKAENKALVAENHALKMQIVAERREHLDAILDEVDRRTEDTKRECKERVELAEDTARAFIAERMKFLFSWYALENNQVPQQALRAEGAKEAENSAVDDWSHFMRRVLAEGGYGGRTVQRNTLLSNAARLDEYHRYKNGGARRETLEKMKRAVQVNEQES